MSSPGPTFPTDPGAKAVARSRIGEKVTASPLKVHRLPDSFAARPAIRRGGSTLQQGAPLAMRIGVLRDTAPRERRVALTPDAVGKLVKGGAAVIVESGAGAGVVRIGRVVSGRRCRDRNGRRSGLGRSGLPGAAPGGARSGVVAGRHGADRARRRARRRNAGRPVAPPGDAAGARARAADHSRPVDGRAVVAGDGRGLQGGAARRSVAGAVPPDAHHRRRIPGAGQSADPRRRRGRAAGHRHRAPARRAGHRLRRAAGRRRRRALARREVPRRRTRSPPRPRPPAATRGNSATNSSAACWRPSTAPSASATWSSPPPRSRASRRRD